MNQPPFAIVHDQHGEALCDEHQFAEFAGLGWQRKDKPVVKVEDEEKPEEKPEDKPEEESEEIEVEEKSEDEVEEESEEIEVEEKSEDEVEETKPVIKSGKASKSKAKKDHDDNGIV